ncbi:hypothetical protein [Endozoicomonas lisbonensis]|uniref:Uncharacterized protein n=1 Tax=Endozoicomonas lisbonensis TaxID=3120522 RepID=A0ABV2SP45_9GAMM
MGCVYVESSRVRAIVCGVNNPFYRLPLADGRRVFMEWHSYLGPTFYHDRHRRREIDDWWEDELINEALEWFQNRGNRA